MKIDPAKNRLFQLGEEGRLVAIDLENQKVLAHLLGQFGKMEKVPDDKTVRGIFVTVSADGFLESIDGSMQQSDVTISQLREIEAQN